MVERTFDGEALNKKLLVGMNELDHQAWSTRWPLTPSRS
jgi:hypothetical protein